MSKDRGQLVFGLGAVLFTLVSGAQGVMAQASRTWVSGTGSDSNGCTRGAPCLTFAHALSQTSAGGEIDALDAGDFGPLNITKAVSIVGTDGFAGIQVATGSAISINAPIGDTVVLRGLALSGQGTAASGSALNTVGVLDGESCTIEGFGTYGFDFEPGGAERVYVKDSIIRDNGYAPPSGTVGGGIFVKPFTSFPSSVTMFVEGTRIENSGGLCATIMW